MHACAGNQRSSHRSALQSLHQRREREAVRCSTRRSQPLTNLFLPHLVVTVPLGLGFRKRAAANCIGRMTFNNLTLYTTTAVLILDTDGNRVIAKYYQPPHAANFLATATPAQQNAVAATTPQLSAKNPLATLKEQRAFEKAIFDKTKRATGDIILYDSHLVLFKASLDVIFYVVGPAVENELMLSGLLSAFYDATSMLVRHQVEKRAILENLDLVTLALDETVDDGIILETDSTTIASRVSRPRPDVNEIQINEQSKYSAVQILIGRFALSL